MKHLALYRKWRPQRFSEVVGQEHVSRTLLNAIRQDQLAHAYLFCGPRGTGKTTSARLLAKALNCTDSQDGEPCNQCQNCLEITAGHSLDVIEIDAASNRGIDSARELREQVRFSASSGRYRVFIIDEFHMLTKEAFNALLKTLEEPPDKVIFVLATTEPHEVLQTVVSRCQRFDFQRISTRELADHLLAVAQAEQIGVSGAALEAMARKANGGLRDGLSLLDQVRAMAMPGESLPDALVYQTLGLVQEEELLAIARAAFGGQLESMLANLRQLLEQGHDAQQILAELIQLLRHLSLSGLAAQRLEQLGVPSHLLGAVQQLGSGLSRGQIVSALDLLLKTSDRLHHCPQPDIWLEADLICWCLQAESSLLERIELLEQGRQNLPLRPQPLAAAEAKPLAVPVARPELIPDPIPETRPQPKPEFQPAMAARQPTEALTELPQSKQPEIQPEPVNQALGRPEPVWSAASVASGDLATLWKAFLDKVKESQRPLIGFLLNGKLVEVHSQSKTWVLEFNSKPHCERIRHSLKQQKLQPLASAVMGENYQIETRLAGAEPARLTPEKKTEPLAPLSPSPALQPQQPVYSAGGVALAQRLQESPPAYQTQSAEDADFVDMDYLPEPPESSLTALLDAPELLSEPVMQPQRQLEPEPEAQSPEAFEPQMLLQPQQKTLSSTQSEEIDLNFASRHPLQAVAELFKGRIIDKR